MKMSSATKRALERNYYQSCEWFCDFKESDVEESVMSLVYIEEIQVVC